jgi:hypothetical protein
MELNSANTVSDVKVNQLKEGILDKLVRLLIFFPMAIVGLMMIKCFITCLLYCFMNDK